MTKITPFLSALSCMLPFAVAAEGPMLKTQYGDVQIFPADSPWNQRIDKLRVHPKSDTFIRSIGPDKNLHPDFGPPWRGRPNGIPYVVVPSNQERVPISFQYQDESDPGPYPIPPNAPIEGGPDAKGDRHILIISPHEKRLYEVFNAYPHGKAWRAGSGAIWDLTRNKLRPMGWTSADAAGLPIFPGLVRYDEVVQQKEIRHALRFTVSRTRKAYIHPATHHASRQDDPSLPPMGMRVRLRATYDISKYPAEVQVILRCLKSYGMILADNGSDWYISGVPDKRWDAEKLRFLKMVQGRDLEVVYTGDTRR